MLTVFEMMTILANIPVLLWALLPVKRIPRFLDFMPLASVVFLLLHLFIDSEPVRLRFIPLYIFTTIAFLVTIKRLFHHNPSQPKKTVGVITSRFLGLVGLTVCVLIPTVVLPFHSLPAPTGDFRVGTVVSDFKDENRNELLSDDATQPREIAVQFWYPIDAARDSILNDIPNAPLSTAKQTYPLIIFSHGSFGMRLSNASAFRELASHGYIVASIDHTYHSFYTSFANGRSVIVNTDFLSTATKIQTNSLPAMETYNLTQDWLNLRTSDMTFLIESLKSGNLGSHASLLDGHMDLSKIGLFGHSLGGAAAAQVARERDDIGAAIVLDGTLIGDIVGVNDDNIDIVTTESFNKPLMLMYGSLYYEPEAKATAYLSNISAFDHATDAAYSLIIKNSGHLNFTDLPRISPLVSGMLGIGTIDSLECIEIVNAYTISFFDKHLKGLSSPLLEGAPASENVEFDMREPSVL